MCFYSLHIFFIFQLPDITSHSFWVHYRENKLNFPIFSYFFLFLLSLLSILVLFAWLLFISSQFVGMFIHLKIFCTENVYSNFIFSNYFSSENFSSFFFSFPPFFINFISVFLLFPYLSLCFSLLSLLSLFLSSIFSNHFSLRILCYFKQTELIVGKKNCRLWFYEDLLAFI